MKNIILGIDPGSDGAIAVIDTKKMKLSYKKFPKTRGKPDYNQLDLWLKRLTKYILITGVEYNKSLSGKTSSGKPRRFGSQQQYSYGWNNGIIYGLLISNSIPFMDFSPQKWQNAIYKGFKLPSTLKTAKDKSFHVATRLFPGNTFLPTKKSIRIHQGCIDASLIAEYARRQFNSGS